LARTEECHPQLGQKYEIVQLGQPVSLASLRFVIHCSRAARRRRSA
jgi:hypothetical protein